MYMFDNFITAQTAYDAFFDLALKVDNELFTWMSIYTRIVMNSIISKTQITFEPPMCPTPSDVEKCFKLLDNYFIGRPYTHRDNTNINPIRALNINHSRIEDLKAVTTPVDNLCEKICAMPTHFKAMACIKNCYLALWINPRAILAVFAKVPIVYALDCKTSTINGTRGTVFINSWSDLILITYDQSLALNISHIHNKVPLVPELFADIQALSKKPNLEFRDILAVFDPQSSPTIRAIAQRLQMLEEIAVLKAERDAACAERDTFKAERDAAHAECDKLRASCENFKHVRENLLTMLSTVVPTNNNEK